MDEFFWLTWFVRIAGVCILFVLVPTLWRGIKGYYAELGIGFYEALMVMLLLLIIVFTGFRLLDNTYPDDPQILEMVRGNIYGQ